MSANPTASQSKLDHLQKPKNQTMTLVVGQKRQIVGQKRQIVGQKRQRIDGPRNWNELLSTPDLPAQILCSFLTLGELFNYSTSTKGCRDFFAKFRIILRIHVP